MLIDDITAFCHEHYNSNACRQCGYIPYCPKNCAGCLEYIHYPKRAPAPRSYDCLRMADYYVCKYSYKYTSEMIYALESLKDIKQMPLKVLSVGCGPCTDLFALDYLQIQGLIDTIEFRGVDLNPIWQNIISEIQNKISRKITVQFFNKDIFSFIDDLLMDGWFPNLVIFQYVFSSMQKDAANTSTIKNFITKFVALADKLPTNAHIVMNDINLSTEYSGGREHFDLLSNSLDGYLQHSFHFVSRERYYRYGKEYPENSLRFQIPSFLTDYYPFEFCSSAQKILKKQGWS
jgi:hypothetical protein